MGLHLLLDVMGVVAYHNREFKAAKVTFKGRNS